MENAWHLVRSIDLTKHKGCLKHGTDHKAYKIMKTNSKNLQKQHGYKHRLYTEKHHQYIKYTKVSKPSMSYKFKLNINHNHSVSNPTHNNNNYSKHKTITINKKIVKTSINICEHTTPPFNMHTPFLFCAALPLTMCCSPPLWHE